ncbi:MAG: CDP-alcohol phosphatidyltransferase family protein, partial [Nitrospinae bacterium]|nr:CDP-alcohol phosphatidyltransferase family protein [Nitrospinota bacterium]
MNLPNGITLLRILVIPFFVMLLIYGMAGWALGVFILTAITDAIDGYIARTRKQRTPLGEVLDPLADKLLLTTAFITLAYLRILPAWLAILVVSRDVILVFGSLLLHLITGSLRLELELRVPVACVPVQGDFMTVDAAGVLLSGTWPAPVNQEGAPLPVIGPMEDANGLFALARPGDWLSEKEHLDAL